MKRRILTILLLAVFFLMTAANPTTVHADGTKGASAHFVPGFKSRTTQQLAGKDNRAEVLKLYLEQYNSPLAEHVDTFVKEADANNLDWKLVAAIAGLESGYGIQIPGGSYNGWGFGIYGNHTRAFANWDDGISTVSTALRTDYLGNNPETNVYQIGARYAASPTWAARVTNNMYQIEQFAARFEKPTLSISL